MSTRIYEYARQACCAPVHLFAFPEDPVGCFILGTIFLSGHMLHNAERPLVSILSFWEHSHQARNYISQPSLRLGKPSDLCD